MLHCTSIYMSSKSVSQIFKFLFQTRDINIFVFRGVFFSRYFQLKFLWVQGAHMFFLYNIVTRNNMVWKLMRRLLFMLLQDFFASAWLHRVHNFFLRKKAVNYLYNLKSSNTIGQRKTANIEKHFYPRLTLLKLLY